MKRATIVFALAASVATLVACTPSASPDPTNSPDTSDSATASVSASPSVSGTSYKSAADVSLALSDHGIKCTDSLAGPASEAEKYYMSEIIFCGKGDTSFVVGTFSGDQRTKFIESRARSTNRHAYVMGADWVIVPVNASRAAAMAKATGGEVRD